MKDFRRALIRNGALVPLKQAIPATRADIEKAMKLTRLRKERWALFVAWKTASRADEVSKLKKDGFEFVPMANSQTKVLIRFAESKSDYKKEGHTIPTVMKAAEAEELRKVPGVCEVERPLQVTTARFAEMLDQARDGLSAHSIK